MRAWLAALLLLVAQSAVAGGAAVRLRWLGVAGFSISDGDTTLLQDPYLSRPGIWQTLTSWYQPDAAVLDPLFGPKSRAPELARARLILIGHSHFDHLGDAPWIALRTGARIAGSQTTVSIARAYGVDAGHALRVDPGATLREGAFTVRVIESRHAKVAFGRVPLDCTIETPPEAPIHALSFCLGDARLYLVTHEPTGTRILLSSSAAVFPPALDALHEEGVSVDALLAATQGRDPDYARSLVAAVRPRLAIPSHFESFFTSLDSSDADAPSDPEDLAAFERELAEAAKAEGVALQVRRLALFEEIELPRPAAGTGG